MACSDRTASEHNSRPWLSVVGAVGAAAGAGFVGSAVDRAGRVVPAFVDAGRDGGGTGPAGLVVVVAGAFVAGGFVAGGFVADEEVAGAPDTTRLPGPVLGAVVGSVGVIRTGGFAETAAVPVDGLAVPADPLGLVAAVAPDEIGSFVNGDAEPAIWVSPAPDWTMPVDGPPEDGKAGWLDARTPVSVGAVDPLTAMELPAPVPEPDGIEPLERPATTKITPTSTAMSTTMKITRRSQ